MTVVEGDSKVHFLIYIYIYIYDNIYIYIYIYIYISLGIGCIYKYIKYIKMYLNWINGILIY